MTCSGIPTSVRADFQRKTVSLSASSSKGGAVILPGEGNFEYSCQTVVDLLAKGSPNYQFIGWAGSGTPAIANPASTSTTITMNSNYTVVANFQYDWSPWSYDNNPSNGIISVQEFLAALADYLSDQISVAQLLEVLTLYLQS